jgi:hypothetical protein
MATPATPAPSQPKARMKVTTTSVGFGKPSLLTAPPVVAPPMATSISLPSPSTAGSGPMDEDISVGPIGPSKKRSIDALSVAVPASSKHQRLSGLSGKGRQGTSVATSSSSLVLVGRSASRPSPFAATLSLEDEDPILTRLEGIELSVRREEYDKALDRIDALRRAYLESRGRRA